MVVDPDASTSPPLEDPLRVEAEEVEGEPGPIPSRVIDARSVPGVSPTRRADTLREALTTLIVAPHLVLIEDLERSALLNPRKVRFSRGLERRLDSLLVAERVRAQQLDAAIEASIDLEARRAAVARPSVWLDMEKPLDALRLGQLGANPVLRTRDGKLLGLTTAEAPESVLQEAKLHALGRNLLSAIVADLRSGGVLEEVEVEALRVSGERVGRK